MARLLRRVAIAIVAGIILSVLLAITVGAGTPPVPLYPPGPPYSRSGNGGSSPNTWSAFGEGNPQFGRSGNIFWWQSPPPPAFG